MIFRVFPALLLVFTACSHRLPRKSSEITYRLVTELSDDLKKLQKATTRSKAELEIDFETGNFKGRYKSHDFTGNYVIEHVSAGFVKGFFYRVRVEDLHKPEPRGAEEEAFFEKLQAADRLYVAPDKLGSPAYTVLEISSPVGVLHAPAQQQTQALPHTTPETKLIFVKMNGKVTNDTNL